MRHAQIDAAMIVYIDVSDAKTLQPPQRKSQWLAEMRLVFRHGCAP